MNTNEALVLTVDEAAEYLRIPKSSLYKLAQEGKIPCQKVGRHWRFHREAIYYWIKGQLEDNSHHDSETKRNQK